MRSQQQMVDAYFNQAAPYWKKIYEAQDVYAAIHQERQTRVLAEVDRLGLPPGSPVLEIGCGAGFTSVALAQRGYAVTAVDSAAAMIGLARENAAQAGVPLTAEVADIRSLPFADRGFTLILAIGVLPFLRPLDAPLREMARLAAPGGHLIVNIDNRWGFSRVFNPQFNPLVAPLRRAAGSLLERAGMRKPQARSYLVSQRGFHRTLTAAGFEILRGATLGFGPFAIFDRQLLSPERGLRLHRRLQELADGGSPVVRGGGAQYLVVARRRG